MGVRCVRRMLLLLLLAGCDARPDAGGEGNDGMPAPQPEAGEPAVGDRGADNLMRAKQALGAILENPASARYSQVRSGAAGSVCGLVDARPFVVTPEGVAVVSPAPKVMFDDPDDVFPDYYIRWCASSEELRRIGPRVVAGPLPALPPIEEYPLVPDAEMPAAPPEALPPPAQGKAEPPSAEEDSFSRAVLRQPGEERK